MSDEPSPNSEIILYQTEDGSTRIQCRLENENLWLTQAQMAELFETTPQNVTLHLKGIIAEGELVEAATCKDFLQVRLEGGREVTRKLQHYRLEAILAVGFRVRSHESRSTRLRLRNVHDSPDQIWRIAEDQGNGQAIIARFRRPPDFQNHHKPPHVQDPRIRF